MGKLPVNFRTASETLVTFGVNDAITGRSILTFNGILAKGNYYLTTAETASNAVTTIDSYTPASLAIYYKRIDKNFDAEFQIPATIEGLALVSFSIGANFVAGPGGSLRLYPIIRVYKVTGGVETEIGTGDASATAYHLLVSTAATATSKRYGIDVDITKTNFKIGDSLRLTVEVWMRRDSANGVVVTGLGNDGVNRNDLGQGESGVPTATNICIEDEDDTTIKFQVPFIPEL